MTQDNKRKSQEETLDNAENNSHDTSNSVGKSDDCVRKLRQPQHRKQKRRKQGPTDQPETLATKTNKRTNGEKIKRLVFLEEQVKIHEATLRCWRQRRDNILAEKEIALAKKRELMDLRAKLIRRQTSLEVAHSKHLILKEELTESLAMSRERLKRLTMLEKEENTIAMGGEEAKESDADMEKGECSVPTDSVSSDVSRETPGDGVETNEEDFDEITGVQVQPPNEEGSFIPDTKSRFLVVSDSYRNADTLETYHCTKQCHRSFSSFLPYLDATQAGDYLTLMVRETYALDDDDDRERSLRRQLLENTCLDVLKVASPDNKTGENSVHSAYADGSLPPFDPNLSLCPYELGGICADDLCPYQHTTKAVKVLARERLPLPSLSSFVSADIGTVKSKPETKENPKVVAAVDKQDADDPTNGDGCSADQELPPVSPKNSLAKDNENGGDEEDLMLLPTPSPPHSDVNGEEDESLSGDSVGSVEVQEGLLSLSAPLGKDSNSGMRYGGSSSFWWGDKFEIHQSNTVNQTLSGDNEEIETSILYILRETFGLVLHNHPEAARTDTENATSSSEKRLEIQLSCVPGSNDPAEESKLVNELRLMGRVIDACRLALHGGLHEMSRALSYEIFEGDIVQYQDLKGFGYLLHEQIEVSRIHYKTPCLSCFHVAFVAQIGMSILSWSMAAHLNEERNQEGENHSNIHLSKSGCEKCWDALISDKSSSEASGIIELKEFLSKSYDNENGLVCATSDDDNNDFTSDIGTEKVNNLQPLIVWAQKNSIPSFEQLNTSEQELEVRLLSIWSTAKQFLKNEKEQKQRDKISDSLGTEFNYLKVLIIMGYSILGCLSNFASATTSLATAKAGIGDERVLGSSTLAAWTLLDGTIARVLKDMRKNLAEFPLVDLVLAPLWACSVASAAFLRNYSMAQNRLMDCLKRNYHLSRSPSSHQSTNMLVYSELLWSQLIQLRMSLPNESLALNPSNLASDFVPFKSNSTSMPKRDATEHFPWEPSPMLKKENRLLIAKLGSLGISLRHIVLWGDWRLSTIAGNACIKRTLLGLLSGNATGLDPGNHYGDNTEGPISIQYKEVLESLNVENPEGDATSASLQLRKSPGSHHPPSSSSFSRLPLFLLYAGRFLTDLNLQGCYLEKLPLTFGLCFPSLRKLDVSHNGLKNLPESFRRLIHRMKFLEELNLCHNQLKVLPSNILSIAVPTASQVTVSGASSKKPIPPLASPPLKILNLSNNQLASVPSLVGLDNLEVLELHHNALVDMTVADWSKLALRLPSLRKLTLEYQVA